MYLFLGERHSWCFQGNPQESVLSFHPGVPGMELGLSGFSTSDFTFQATPAERHRDLTTTVYSTRLFPLKEKGRKALSQVSVF